jgi:cytochrome c oxidase subunit II
MNELMRRLLFLPPQSSTVASAIDHLHYFVITTTMVGALFITIVGFWLVIRFRRPSGAAIPPREEPAPKVPLWMEVAVVGGLLSLFCFWWLIGFLQYVRVRVPPENTLDIHVTAKQWMWKFSYSDGNHSIATVYVPAGRAVKLIMTSRDVIHSFYVPDFRVKQDVLPGRYTTLWFQADRPGTHQILCAEFCGAGHSTMRGEVVVLDPADYTRWLEGTRALSKVEATRYIEPAAVDEFQPIDQLPLVELGERAAADHGCLRCHTLDGTPHIGPSFVGLYQSTVPLTDGQTARVDEAYITESMMDPRVKVHRGFQPVMPSYHGLIRPAETGAIIELIKSLREGGRP